MMKKDSQLKPPKHAKFKQHPAVASSEVDDQATLFQSKNCDYFVLNKASTAIWVILKKPRTLNQICLQLCAEFNVEISECKKEVEYWLEQALEREIISVVGD